MIFTVAIDGPAAAGKGTIARAVAAHFGFAYLDTGLLYRAAARKVLDGIDPVAAAKALTPHDFERADLRTAKVGQAASKIAAMPAVRAALVDFQHRFARADGGAVMGGGAYLVGERGPEVFRPGGAGVIEPVGGGGITVNVRVDGGAPGLMRSEAQIAQMLARAVSLGARRM